MTDRLRNPVAGRRFARGRAFAAAMALVAIAFAVDCAPVFARDRVLLVGNSFSAGLRPMLRALTRSAGRDVVVMSRAVRGWTLAHHAASGSTMRKIGSTSWNAVVLQEQSIGEFEERYPAARAIDAEIPGRTIFFMTWRDQEEDIEWYDYLMGEPGGVVGYVPIAYELGASIAPVGWVFREIILQETNPDLWASDGHHASERGKYIACLVFYATIFGESPVGLWVPSSLDVGEAIADQLLVEQLVLADPARWYIDADPVGATPETDSGNP